MAHQEPLLLIDCRSTLEDIRTTLQIVETTLSGPIDPAQLADINLVLTELMTNIARHGYPDTTGHISLRLCRGPDSVECQIVDTGAPFDPTSLGQNPPEPMAFPEGGFGWFIIRQLARHIRYQRDRDRNVLRLSVPMARVAETVSSV